MLLHESERATSAKGRCLRTLFHTWLATPTRGPMRDVMKTEKMRTVPAEAVPALPPVLQRTVAKRTTGEGLSTGTPGWNRTSDIRLRRPTLYPAELRAQRRRVP